MLLPHVSLSASSAFLAGSCPAGLEPPCTEDGVWRGRLPPRQPHLQPLGGLLVVHGLVIGWRPLLGRLEPEEELVGVVWRGLDYQAPPATLPVTTDNTTVREDIQKRWKRTLLREVSQSH